MATETERERERVRLGKLFGTKSKMIILIAILVAVSVAEAAPLRERHGRAVIVNPLKWHRSSRRTDGTSALSGGSGARGVLSDLLRHEMN